MIVTVRCPTCDRPIEVDDGLTQTALTCWTCRRSRRIEFEQQVSPEVQGMEGALLRKAVKRHRARFVRRA